MRRNGYDSYHGRSRVRTFLKVLIVLLLVVLALAGGLEELTAEKLTEILNFANHAAALTCTRPGAIPAMPTLSEVLSRKETVR